MSRLIMIFPWIDDFSLKIPVHKPGVGASKRPCVFAHGYISLQWCSKVSPQRERFFRDIYILWVCQKSWKGMEKLQSRCDFTGFCGTKAIMLEKAAVRFFFSLFQPLLRQRSPRHLYMSLWQFLRHRKPRHISWCLSNNKIIYIYICYNKII